MDVIRTGAGPVSGRPATRQPAVLSVSAVICTRDRPDQLVRALGSLCSQESVDEVLVVDNAPSSDATRERVLRDFPSARYVREPTAGLDTARNRALQEARSEIVAFLDDDAVAGPGWARAWLAAFGRDRRLAACTGRVEALSLATEGQRLFEANGGFDRGADPIRLPRDAAHRLHGLPAPRIAWAMSIGCGCSLALRRECALAIGGFDEGFDMGTPIPGGGDLDILWRLLEAGNGVAYEPAALARHEHRRTREAAVGQIVGHQRAVSAFLVKAAIRSRGRTRVEVLAVFGWRLVKPFVRLGRRCVGRDPLSAPDLLRMAWNSWLGPVAYLRSRRSRELTS